MSEQIRRGSRGSLPREEVTTQGAVEADFGPPMAGTPERPWESPFRFDLIHDREGLNGHWPGDEL